MARTLPDREEATKSNKAYIMKLNFKNNINFRDVTSSIFIQSSLGERGEWLPGRDKKADQRWL